MRRSSSMPIAIILIGVALLIGGGIYVRSETRCQALENQYLNSVSAARQSVMLREIAPDSRAMANVSSGLADTELEAAEGYLRQLYDHCGERAGRTAFRKGTSITLRGVGSAD